MTSPEATQRALEPLRTALLDRARARADHIRRAADADGRRVLDAATAEANALLAAARAEGAADAAALLRIEATRSRHEIRGILLTAQRSAYDELRGHARLAVRTLLADPAIRAQLVAMIRRRLGDRATIHDAPDGGLLAQAPDGRSVDASVAALVDRAVAGLHPEQLWSTG
jgi:hypothetical protein